MAEYVYRGAASKICGVNPKTWDKYVKDKLITPDGEDPFGHIYFRIDKVKRFAKLLSKDRKPGLPLIANEDRKALKKKIR